VPFTAIGQGSGPGTEQRLPCEPSEFDISVYLSIATSSQWILQEPVCTVSMAGDSPVIKASAISGGHRGELGMLKEQA
jgi:hypothetical protein